MVARFELLSGTPDVSAMGEEVSTLSVSSPLPSLVESVEDEGQKETLVKYVKVGEMIMQTPCSTLLPPIN